MKLLIITQTVDINDQILGFFHRWLLEFAVNCEQVTIICLQKGEYDVPDNVKVLSLGKEGGISKIKYIRNFYKYIWQERKNYDAVFAHMNPEYVVLGGVFWQLWHKKIALWYTHKSVNLKLRVATFFADIIFSASKESFRLLTKKLNIMEHGIDVEQFVPSSQKLKENIILSVDRISPTKNQLDIVKIFAEIKSKIPDAILQIVGAPIRESDKEYLKEIKQYIKNNSLENDVKFLGSIANINMPAIYQQAKVFVNFSSTGSLDKTVLEAMSCNVAPITINEAFKNIVPANNYFENKEEAQQQIIKFLQNSEVVNYREIITTNHNLKNLIKNIVKECVE